MARLVEPGPLVIVGAGGFGRECLDIVEALNTDGAGIEFIGFTDDRFGDESILRRPGVACLGPVGTTPEHAARWVIAIGDPVIRRRIAERIAPSAFASVVLVHPQATLGSQSRVGGGTILNAGARATTNITLGSHVHLHANCTIGHDATLGDYVSVFPGATVSGSVEIGDDVTVGTGANILPGLSVGARSTIGAGAVVTCDVPPGSVFVGVPARPLRNGPNGRSDRHAQGR